VVTRFPPEPNGFPATSAPPSRSAINFGIAAEFGGVCHLRFDDTNPETEDLKYVESIRRDVRWLRIRLEREALLRLGVLRTALRTGGSA